MVGSRDLCVGGGVIGGGTTQLHRSVTLWTKVSETLIRTSACLPCPTRGPSAYWPMRYGGVSTLILAMCDGSIEPGGMHDMRRSSAELDERARGIGICARTVARRRAHQPRGRAALRFLARFVSFNCGGGFLEAEGSGADV